MAVLIADNDRAVSGLLTDVLMQSGMQLMHAYDGDEAIRQARDERVHVLVCDLDMPGASGLEVLESLQSLAEPPRSIVISGYLDTAIEARLRAMPFVDEVMRKPFDLLVFAAVVRRVVAKAAQLKADEGAGSPPGKAQNDPLGSHARKVRDDGGDGPANRGVATER